MQITCANLFNKLLPRTTVRISFIRRLNKRQELRFEVPVCFFIIAQNIISKKIL